MSATRSDRSSGLSRDELGCRVCERTTDLLRTVETLQGEVNQRLQAERSFRDSEEKYRALTESTNDVVYSVDSAGRITYVSPQVAHYGFSQGQLLDRNLLELVAGADRDKVADDFHRSMISGQEAMSQFRVIDASGREVWMEDFGKVRRDERGDIVGMVGVLRDVTQRRTAEDRLRAAHEALRSKTAQLRALASELTLAEHRQRQKLAQVLHDGLQQILVGARYHMGTLARSGDPRVATPARQVADMLGEAIAVSRSLTAELGPPILREGGLPPALEWLANSMRERHGLSVQVRCRGRLPQLREELVVLLFQAVRELLFNAVKHARADRAQVGVLRRGDRITVSVSDGGAGFDPSRLCAEGGPAGGFGLFSIHERIQLLGGRMSVRSAPGRGSRFTLVVPISPGAADNHAAAPPAAADASAAGRLARPKRPRSRRAKLTPAKKRTRTI